MARSGIRSYFSLALSVWTLRTEKKAQERTYELLREQGMATEDEIDAMRRLFRPYNIEYVDDIALSFLEVLYYILQIAADKDLRVSKWASRPALGGRRPVSRHGSEGNN